MNVVRMWRSRGLQLGRRGFRCEACSALFMVKRRLCAHCGAPELVDVDLPRHGTVEATTVADLRLERVDQLATRRSAVLLTLEGGRLCCLIAEGDAALIGHVHGDQLRVAVRRLPGLDDPRLPIFYGIRAAVSLSSRALWRGARETTSRGASE